MQGGRKGDQTVAKATTRRPTKKRACQQPDPNAPEGVGTFFEQPASCPHLLTQRFELLQHDYPPYETK